MLPAGDYAATIILRDSKGLIGKVERTFTKPETPKWLGNKLGIIIKIGLRVVDLGVAGPAVAGEYFMV